jgi:hypothetical protein
VTEIATESRRTSKLCAAVTGYDTQIWSSSPSAHQINNGNCLVVVPSPINLGWETNGTDFVDVLAARVTKSDTLACQEHVDFAEGRPLRSVDVPTLEHQVVDLAGTDAGLRQSWQRHRRRRRREADDVVAHQLRVGKPIERATAGKAHQFPESDAERPDIRTRRVLSLRRRRHINN